LVPDGITRLLTVKRGSTVKSVSLDYQSLSDLTSRPKQAEARRAERLWDVIAGFAPQGTAAEHR